jgi:hypothetical protein
MAASRKQIHANRPNAQKSTGPKSPQGKKISSRNATRYGPHAKDVVISSPFHKRKQDTLTPACAPSVPHTPVANPMSGLHQRYELCVRQMSSSARPSSPGRLHAAGEPSIPETKKQQNEPISPQPPVSHEKDTSPRPARTPATNCEPFRERQGYGRYRET